MDEISNLVELSHKRTQTSINLWTRWLEAKGLFNSNYSLCQPTSDFAISHGRVEVKPTQIQSALQSNQSLKDKQNRVSERKEKKKKLLTRSPSSESDLALQNQKCMSQPPPPRPKPLAGSYLKTLPASEILEWRTTGGSENRQTQGGTLSDNTRGLLALDCAVIAPFIKRMYWVNKVPAALGGMTAESD